MAIVATDLVTYNAASRPQDDTSTAGGSRDVDVRPTFTQWTATAQVAFQSSSGSDVGNVTVTGRAASGAFQTETFALTGVTEKLSTNSYERILEILMAADAVGTITVKQGSGGTLRYTIPVGERGCAACFKLSASEASIAIRYDLIYWMNQNGTLTLNSAKYRLSADPDARIRHGLAAAKGNLSTITNRKTTPAGITFVDDNVDQNLTPPNDTLAAAEVMGVWIEENLPASDPPHKTTFTLQLAGTSV